MTLWRLYVGDLRVCRVPMTGSLTCVQPPPSLFSDRPWWLHLIGASPCSKQHPNHRPPIQNPRKKQPPQKTSTKLPNETTTATKHQNTNKHQTITKPTDHHANHRQDQHN